MSTDCEFYPLSHADSLPFHRIAAFNLINSVDVQETEARIKAYQAANASLISQNARADAAEAARIRDQDALDQSRRDRARQLAADRETAEAAEREASEKALMAQIENVSDESEIQRILKKARKESQKRKAEASTVPDEWAHLMRPPSPEPVAAGPNNESELEDAPRELWYDYSDLFTLGNYLSDPWNAMGSGEQAELQKIRADAGGFRTEAVWERSVRSAVQGMFCRPLDWPAEDVQLAGTA